MKKILATIGFVLLVIVSVLSTIFVLIPVLKQQAVHPLALLIVGIPLEISFSLIYISEENSGENQAQKRVFKGCMIVIGVILLVFGVIQLIGMIL